MRKITFSVLFITTLVFFSCTKEKTVQIDTNSSVDYTQVKRTIQVSFETIKTVHGLKDFDLDTRTAQFIVVPAGSNNALVKAIADAGEGGVVYLKSGVHTETASITIRQRVVLIGEDGAVLKIQSAAKPANANGSQSIEVAVHVQNAQRTLIQNIDFQPITGDGGAAILFENAHESAAMNCSITKHQAGVLVQKCDRMTIMRNKVSTITAWQTGTIPNVQGIVIINGTSAYLSDNVVSNAFFGIWACDKYGTLEHNTTTGNYIGVIVCNVPTAFILPSGTLVGSLVPGAYWKVRNNTSTDNFNDGYIVIDGANNNILENNQAARNGAYDIELTGDSYRFGFLTPLSYNNTVQAVAGQKVKNCGVNNTVIGGNLVDNATDPCK